MAQKDERWSIWLDRLRHLEGSPFIPVWAAALLIAGFVMFGGLDMLWAVIGLVGLAIFSVLGLGHGVSEVSEAYKVSETTAPAAREETWQLVLEAIPEAAILIDNQKNILAANAQARSISSFALGGSVLQLRFPQLLDAIDEALTHQVSTNFEIRPLVPVERYLVGTATPIRARRENFGSLLVVLRDRTEMEKLDLMRADFVANASHELRTPLASLKGFIETLQCAAKDDPEARQHFLGIMRQQSERMSRLIDDLLSLSRIEMSKSVAPTTVVDVAEIADNIANAMQPVASESPCQLATHVSERPALVVGDPDQIAQVLQNLIQNAIKYGRKNGKVAVTVLREDAHVHVVVADDGGGIAAEHLPRLTERFYRVSASTSRALGGTGLGLAIVKHIVDRHGGELKIESRLSEGSKFSVVLPAASVSGPCG